MIGSSETWAGRAVVAVVLSLLAVMLAALYAIHSQQNETLEEAFVQKTDTLLMGVEIQSGSLIESFDWPILERIQQDAAAAPSVKSLWIEDYLSKRTYGDSNDKVTEGARRFSREIIVDGELVGRVVALVFTEELSQQQADSFRLSSLVFGASGLAILFVVAIFVFFRNRASRKILLAQASRMLAERELTKSVDNFRAMAEDLSESVLIHRNGRLLFANAAYLKTFLYEKIEPQIDGSLLAYLPCIDENEKLARPHPNEGMSVVARTAYQVEVQRHDGQTIWVEMRSFPMGWDGSSAVCSTLVDISARRDAEKSLENARNEAELANRAKSTFLSSMSHELRTPMNAILGFGQLLESSPEEPLTEGQTECVEHIVKSGKHLLDLINDILDLSRIEANKMDVSVENILLAEVIGECLPLIGIMATQRGIKISVPKATDGRMVCADRIRLKQVLLNLMSNAVKYNRENGTVTVSIGEVTNNMLRVTVTDTGYGISEDKQHELFKPFSRLGADDSAVEGTGIGLVVSKKLTELMNGFIGLESKEDEGTSFWVELPMAKADNNEVVEAKCDTSVDIEDLFLGIHGTLLYVEDNPSNLKLMELMVSRIEGLSMISAQTAEAGIELARENKPDVIILDINLPGMSGIEAVKKLHLYDDTRNIPVLALSAAATKRDIEKGLAAGFLHYLTKPIEVSGVVEAIRSALKLT